VKYLFPVITAFFVSNLLLGMNLIQLVYSQDNPADIIKKSQENLKKFENKNATPSQSPSSQKVPATVTSVPKPTADFTNTNYNLLFSKPNGYLGATVDLTGKVSNFPEVGLLQMYVGGAVSHDAVVHYNDSFVFVEDECVKVTGVVEEEFVGINAFSATRTLPSISARTIDKVDCTQAIIPAVKTVISEKTQIKGGIKVVFHKVEFSDKNTRVYLTVENLNKKAGIGFYDFNAKAFQGKRQYSTTYSYDVDYPKIKSDIPSGIEESGVVLFDPLDYKTQRSAKFQFEGTRLDTYANLNFIFLVGIPL
jgi:hypothetical protein